MSKAKNENVNNAAEVIDEELQDVEVIDDEQQQDAQEAADEAADCEVEVEVEDEAAGEGKKEAELSTDEALAKELADTKDKYVRLQAEWDNFRKRTNAERAQERVRATERLVENLLPIIDDMERAIEHGENSSDQGMLEGVKAVRNKFIDTLERQGLKAIDPSPGDAFDMEIHQAVAKAEDDSMPDESISAVYQKGYQMGDKLLRPAMVVVSTGGPKRPEE